MSGTTGTGKGLVLMSPTVEMLSDVSAPVANNGDVLTYQAATGQWVAAAAGGGISALTGDVSASGTGTVSAVVVAIQNTQVSAGTISDNQVLTYKSAKSKWVPRAVTGSGTVTSVAVSGKTGIAVSGSPITGAGVITLTLGAISPTSITTGGGAFSSIVSANAGIRATTVSASGVIGASNLSGTNTGDQTITLTGDVSGSGTGSFATVVTRIQGTQVSAGTPATGEVLTIAADGKWSPRAVAGTGTVTSVSAGAGLTASPNPITGSGSIQMSTTGVSAGRYTNPTIDINVLGVIISAANGSGGSSTPTFIFGTGFDGNVTISSGTTTLTRDMYYNNLTLSGTGSLNPNGYRIYVTGTLDLTNAPANAIARKGVAGTAGQSNGTAGVGGIPIQTSGYSVFIVGYSAGDGGAGNATTGTDGGQQTSTASATYYNGGESRDAGAGGNGVGGNGGAGGTGTDGTGLILYPAYSPNSISGTLTAIGPGYSGVGGGGGGGSGAVSGGGGGGGGSGGQVIAIFANTISRGGSTTASCITVAGASAGAGGDVSGSIVANGGGGGGSGGAGGWILIVYGTLSGSTGTNALDASSGAGGAGGAGHGTGTGGNGGSSGDGGRITIVNATANTTTETVGSTGNAGGAHSGTTGGTAGAAITTKVNL